MQRTRTAAPLVLAAVGTAVAVAALVVGVVALRDDNTDAPAKGNAPAYTVWLVEQALDRYDGEGLDATLDHYNSRASVDGPWYVFIVNEEGLITGHYDAEVRGQSLIGPIGTDITGYEFGRAMVAAGEEGRWVTYVFTNPETGQHQRKHSWVVRHDRYLFGSGWYDFSSYLGQDGRGVAGAAVGSDPVAETYVRELCLAGDDFEATYGAEVARFEDGADPEEGDPVAFAAVFHEALRGLAANLALITPPDDVAGYHAAATERYEELVTVLDAITSALDAGREPAPGDVARFEELLERGATMPRLPSADANRLAQAANHVPACFGSGFLLGFLSGRP